MVEWDSSDVELGDDVIFPFFGILFMIICLFFMFQMFSRRGFMGSHRDGEIDELKREIRELKEEIQSLKK